MLNLKELNQTIYNKRNEDYLAFYCDMKKSFPDFEEAIKATAAVGGRNGTYSFKLPTHYNEYTTVVPSSDEIEKELVAQYKPIMISVETVSVGVSMSRLPYVAVSYIIPAATNLKPEDYGYQLTDVREDY